MKQHKQMSSQTFFLKIITRVICMDFLVSLDVVERLVATVDPTEPFFVGPCRVALTKGLRHHVPSHRRGQTDKTS